MNVEYLLIETCDREFLVDKETGEILLQSEEGYVLRAEKILNYFQLNFVSIDLKEN